MGGQKDKFANLVHRLEAAGHAGESACYCGTGLHDQIQSSTYRSPEVLFFWAIGREKKGLGLIWAGGRKDLAAKHPGVKFMAREMCSPGLQAERGWGDGSAQAVCCTFLWGRKGEQAEETAGEVKLWGYNSLCALCTAAREGLERTEVVTDHLNPTGHPCATRTLLPTCYQPPHSSFCSFSHLPADSPVSAGGYRGAAAARTPSGWIPGMGESGRLH